MIKNCQPDTMPSNANPGTRDSKNNKRSRHYSSSNKYNNSNTSSENVYNNYNVSLGCGGGFTEKNNGSMSGGGYGNKKSSTSKMVLNNHKNIQKAILNNNLHNMSTNNTNGYMTMDIKGLGRRNLSIEQKQVKDKLLELRKKQKCSKNASSVSNRNEQTHSMIQNIIKNTTEKSKSKNATSLSESKNIGGWNGANSSYRKMTSSSNYNPQVQQQVTGGCEARSNGSGNNVNDGNFFNKMICGNNSKDSSNIVNGQV